MKYLKIFELFDNNEELNLRDFLFLYLKDVELFINYRNNISIRKTKRGYLIPLRNQRELLSSLPSKSILVTVKSFVDEYIKMAIRAKQWSGGPLNREWANKYHQFFNLRQPNFLDKPTIDLKLIFEDNSVFTVGFNIISKNCSKVVFGDTISGTMGFNFYRRLYNNDFNTGKRYSDYTYDYYYDMIHRIIPDFKFNWTGDPKYI